VGGGWWVNGGSTTAYIVSHCDLMEVGRFNDERGDDEGNNKKREGRRRAVEQ
jgi:hypothetical protein